MPIKILTVPFAVVIRVWSSYDMLSTLKSDNTYLFVTNPSVDILVRETLRFLMDCGMTTFMS